MLYLYGMRARGFSIGCQPKENYHSRYDSCSHRWYDIIAYTEKLTDDDVTQYELDYLGEAEQRCCDCKYFWEDRSVNDTECQNDNMTEDELIKYYEDYNEGCPHFELDVDRIVSAYLETEMIIGAEDELSRDNY